MSFLLTIMLLLLVIAFLFMILSWVWPPDSPWAPWWRTSKEKARAICRLAGVKKGDIVYELGSGEGNTLLVAAKEFEATCVGIEIDPLRAFLAKLVAWSSIDADKIKIIRGNFFDYSLKDATVIFVYLVPKTLHRLLPKLKKELRSGTRIVSLKYTMELSLVKEDKKNNLYLYIV